MFQRTYPFLTNVPSSHIHHQFCQNVILNRGGFLGLSKLDVGVTGTDTDTNFI